jgi:hypothetical protein
VPTIKLDLHRDDFRILKMKKWKTSPEKSYSLSEKPKDILPVTHVQLHWEIHQKMLHS